ESNFHSRPASIHSLWIDSDAVIANRASSVHGDETSGKLAEAARRSAWNHHHQADVRERRQQGFDRPLRGNRAVAESVSWSHIGDERAADTRDAAVGSVAVRGAGSAAQSHHCCRGVGIRSSRGRSGARNRPLRVLGNQ
ncbi:putative uncharacterized protein (fragment), partial [Rhodococcus sp. AW25M09]